MPYSHVRGLKLHYLDHYEGQGSAIIFFTNLAVMRVHGLSRWETLASRKIHLYVALCYLPEGICRPMRRTPASYRWKNNSDDALGLIYPLGLEQRELIDLRMGAYIARKLTFHAPERVRSSVCASVGAGADPSSLLAFIEDAIASASHICNTGVALAREIALAPHRVKPGSKNEKAQHEFFSILHHLFL